MKLPWDAIKRMAEAVPDALMSEVVRDQRGGVSKASGLAEPGKETPKVRGSGWTEAVPLRSPPGIEVCDRLVDAQDAMDRVERERKLRGA